MELSPSLSALLDFVSDYTKRLLEALNYIDYLFLVKRLRLLVSLQFLTFLGEMHTGLLLQGLGTFLLFNVEGLNTDCRLFSS